MGHFNLATPDVLGMEPRYQGQTLVKLNDGIAALQRFRPGAATLRKIHAYIQYAQGHNPGVAFEVISGDVMPDQIVGNYFPGVDVTTTKWLKQDGTGGTDFYTKVADFYDTSGFIRNSSAISYRERRPLVFRGNATALTGKRVQALVISCQAMMFQWRDSPYSAFRGFIDIGGQRYYGSDVWWPNDFQWHRPDFIAGWLRNPATNQPWTQAEINSIVATGSTNKFGVDVTIVPGNYNQLDTNAIAISGIQLGTVEMAENRAQSGSAFKYVTNTPRTGWDAYQLSADTTLSANTWYWLLMTAYNGTATSSGNHITIPHFQDDQGTVVKTDDATVTNKQGRVTLGAQLQQHVPLNTIPDNTKPTPPTGTNGTIPFLLEDSGGSILACSQPYAELDRADIHVSSLANRGQRVTPASNKDYGAIIGTLGWGSYNQPTAPLVVEVRSAINGGSLLASVSLQPNPQDTWVRDRFLILDTTVSAVTSTPLFIHLKSSTAASAPWRILQYDTRSDNIKSGSGSTVAKVEGASLGGQTDGYFESGTLKTRWDLGIALFAAPEVPPLTITTVDAT